AQIVKRKVPGNYALGSVYGFPKKLRVRYVGRSDGDLQARLLQHAAEGKYPYFKFAEATSPRAAFERECQNYHDFIRFIDNDIHPQRPAGAGWQCPRCNTFQATA